VTRGPVEATIERGWREVAEIDDAYERGEIDQAGWHARMAALIVPAYLRGANPRAQSGYGGDEADWRQARSLVAEAIPRSGTFLDIGCASGLLMESVAAWCGERGLAIEPYGVDIAPELAQLARARLPHWADRIFAGNAATWRPPRRFDFVRAGVEYAPRPHRGAFLEHLALHFVAPGGRLLVGPASFECDESRAGQPMEDAVRAAGLRVGGRIDRIHPRDDRVVRRLVWADVD
jgi:hypothetical protein